MILGRIISAITRAERNKINENFRIIEEHANGMQNQINNLVVSTDNPLEVIQARIAANGDQFTTLKERLDQEYNNKADLNELRTAQAEILLRPTADEVNRQIQGLSGGPRGVYETLAQLQAAFPSGNSNVYVVSADGGWYYYNGSAWTRGGTYQAAQGDIAELNEFRTVSELNQETFTSSAYNASASSFTRFGSMIQTKEDVVLTSFDIRYGSRREGEVEGLFDVEVIELDFNTQLPVRVVYRKIYREATGEIIPSTTVNHVVNVPLDKNKKYALVGSSTTMNVTLRQAQPEGTGIKLGRTADIFTRYTASSGAIVTTFENYFFRNIKLDNSRNVLAQYHYPKSHGYLNKIDNKLPLDVEINDIILIV